MRTTPASIALALLALSFAGRAVVADPPGLKPLDIGAPAPDFNLPGVDGRNHTLQDYGSARALVVVFTCNHCPTAQAYEARLAKLHDDYKDKGVALVAISPNDAKAVRLDELGYTDLGDSLEDMKIRARDHKYAYPYLYDGDTQATSKAYGALATPHVFIFDADRKLRYQGRFDDGEVKAIKSHDALDALQAVLAGKTVERSTTRVFGCSTKWAEKQADAVKSLEKWDAEPVAIEPISLQGVAKLAKNETDKYTVVNVWATWCGPCVQELPEFVTMNRMYRKRPFQLITISLDDPAKKAEALATLKEKHVSSLNYILDSADRDAFAEALDPKWPGPVPYTLVIAPGGEVVYRKSGGVDPLELKRAIVEKIGRTY
ncbi:redoxin domain-containing protein [Paludisphaera rhizosphaerae]|uniref:redoxin domain-containing protein n=1 Tax=Paludisphaera rhizosphaerae TaxID=2711216 RepID=UPI0013EAC009|nr:redoxin domain-containing protein [Paludisphaera rhizosphaerae]